MGAIIALQGVYGYVLLARSGDMVIDTFDRPMMAINYARAANFDFAQIERKLLERASVRHDARIMLDNEIDSLTSSFAADLAVAAERSTQVDEVRQIETIKFLVDGWTTARRSGKTVQMAALATRIDDAFDLLIEYYTDHSFVDRRVAVDSLAEFRYVLISGLVGSLLLAFFTTHFLTRQIAHPLVQAASVADRVAAGEFETQIPAGGPDETGILLRSLSVMQANIRTMVEREKARAESAEGRLAEALETSDEGVMLVGPDNRVVVVNSRFRAYFPEASSGLTPGSSYLALTGRLSGLLAKRPDETVRDADSFGAGEHRLPDGRWIRVSISPTSDHGKIVFISDFTQIKQREETYKQAKHEAEAASAAKSRFLANMSHELRTPLNAIIGFSEIIASQLFGTAGSPRYVDYAKDILHSGRHLLDVINSVLDLSKSEAGKLSLRLESVDLREILSDCVKMVSEQCTEAGLSLNVRGLDAPLNVQGEKAKLRQIFLNLMSNAIKFTETGGVVSLAVQKHKDAIAVSVSDTGIGMSPSDIQIALTPFGQVDNRLERKYDGTGLGLPLTKTFVELHGGTLQIESTVGRGTTVTVRLLVLAPAAAELASA